MTIEELSELLMLCSSNMQWFIGNRAEVSQVALLCVAQSQVAIKGRSVKVIEVILSQDQPLNGKSSPGG